MARMLPKQYDSSTVSAAERRLFDILSNDPATDGWVVIHSLGLVRRRGKPYGEVDFVVIVPGAGVLCLEVKGGRVSVEGGEWTTVDRSGQVARLKRSPFLQAREGAFALRDSVYSRAPADFPERIVFGYGVVFADVEFDAESPEWESWQVIDANTLRRPISQAIVQMLKRYRELHSYVGADREPTPHVIRQLTSMLRPDFEAIVTHGTTLQRVEERLLRLTEEQFDALDVLDANDHCLVEGAAGTGKTVLALEFARRSAVSGCKTLLLCYNQLLGAYLAERAAAFGVGDLLVAGRYNQLLRRQVLRSSFRSDLLLEEATATSERIFSDVLPVLGLQALEELDNPFDRIVIDEAQDLVSHQTLPVLDAWLKGGLSNGKWAFFADFRRQAIFGETTSPDAKRQQIRALSRSFTTVPLSLNCRNTRNIAEETALLAGFDTPPYRLGQVDGPAVDYRYYSSDSEQRSQLGSAINGLLKGGVAPEHIIVLSRRRLETSGVNGADDGQPFALRDIQDTRTTGRLKTIRFATIQAFKGMESPVVVLADVDSVGDGQPQSMLYVGMSRARSILILLVSTVAQPGIRDCVRRKVLNGTMERAR